jgi:hypothetical protein
MAESAYRVRESFAVYDGAGNPRVLPAGAFIKGDDPLVRTHKALLQPISQHIEQATAGPGEIRPVTIPAEPRIGTRNTKETDMPHALPPEHEDSPASPFAPGQPAAGIVADDVPPEQNPAGKPKAADAPTIHNTPPEPQTPLQEANAEAAKDAAKASKARK